MWSARYHVTKETSRFILSTGAPGPLVHYISLRMENRGGAPGGTSELYFTEPDGLLIQLQDVSYCDGGRVLGEVCTG
jgi:hypothetical protein